MEVWEYENPISIKDEIPVDENSEMLIAHKATEPKNKRRTFDELSNEEQEQRLNKMKSQRLKAKHNLLRIVDCNYCKKTSFLTLTVKENIKDRETFNNMFKAFIKRFYYHVYKTKKSKLKYIACLEQQKRGAYHAHLLLFDVPFIPHKKLLEIWGHGGVTINNLQHLDDVSNTGRYVAKYMEKGIGQELLDSFGKKSYYASRNLKRPTEIKTTNSSDFEIDEANVLYENSYSSKVYRNGKFIDNPVTYKKIKIDKGG